MATPAVPMSVCSLWAGEGGGQRGDVGGGTSARLAGPLAPSACLPGGLPSAVHSSAAGGVFGP